ncbi:MAG: hypothetical protein PHR84_00730 [Candidatus Omnitrophica bacterium]|jgi:hypothetical protein|nr:hypothetical protein [Candidatus Omnitrophota bacterium]MDD5660748.1 hypothetical protein [Candidatus Omnitrophota bacterium]
MRKYLNFLKGSSLVIKVAAWISLFFGIVGSVPLLLGRVPNNPRWAGLVVLLFYSFMFFFFFLVAKISDILIQIINETHKD